MRSAPSAASAQRGARSASPLCVRGAPHKHPTAAAGSNLQLFADDEREGRACGGALPRLKFVGNPRAVNPAAHGPPPNPSLAPSRGFTGAIPARGSHAAVRANLPSPTPHASSRHRTPGMQRGPTPARAPAESPTELTPKVPGLPPHGPRPRGAPSFRTTGRRVQTVRPSRRAPLRQTLRTLDRRAHRPRHGRYSSHRQVQGQPALHPDTQPLFGARAAAGSADHVASGSGGGRGKGRGVPVMVSPDYDNDAWDGFFKGW